MTDLDSVAGEYGLTAEEKDGARALIDVGKAEVVSDYCEPLVKAGAHPLQALMSLHVIYGDHRKAAKMAAEKVHEEKA